MKDDVHKTGPTVSVIMPTYQREEAIGRGIRSVLSQRGLGRSAIEIVVVDDGSTDKTEQVVKAIEVPPPHRIVYKKLEHIGQPGLVRNEGLATAKGDYIGYCDSDDIWLPHHLATCLRQFELYPDSVMVETWWSFQTREKSLDRWKIEYQKASTDGRTTTTNSRLHRRDVLTRSGLFGDLRWGEDIDLWTRIGFVGPIRRIKIPTTAHAYTRGGDNLTFEFCPDIGQQYNGLPPGPPARNEELAAPPLPEPPQFDELAVLPEPLARRTIKAPVDFGVGRALNLSLGTTVSGTITGNLVAAGSIAAFGVQVGTHTGAATGDLIVELTVGRRRAGGRASINNAADNATLMIPLSPRLAVNANEDVRYKINQPGGAAVALWLSPTTTPALQLSPYWFAGGLAARWTLEYAVDKPPAVWSVKLKQSAKRIAKRVIPKQIKQNPTFRRTAFWVIGKVRGRS